MNYKYYQSKNFKNVFYAKDQDNNVYIYENYSWMWPQKYWQLATWKDNIAYINSRIQTSEYSIELSEKQLEKMDIPRITPSSTRKQSAYEYFQDYEEDWIFFAKDERNNIYLFRDPNNPYYADGENDEVLSGNWEKVNEEDFIVYCKDTMRAMSQSTPRSEEFLDMHKIPRIEADKVIPCKVNHI